MEITGDDSSDRDKKMKESFDSLSEKDKDKKEKSDAKKPEFKLPLFEVARDEKDDSEKDKSLFDFLKPEKNNDEESEIESLEQLDSEETEYVVAEYIQARTDELSEEHDAIPAPDVEAKAAAEANTAFLENLREANEEAPVESDEALDEILSETAKELGLPTPEAGEPESTPDEELEEASSVPVPPSGSSTRTTFPPIGGEPAPAEKPAPTERTVYVENRRKQAANLLVGGAVGYLIGRRRGRIKTEKRLLPVQEKLKKQVSTLHGKIAEREEQIRNLASEKVRNSPETKDKPTVQKPEVRIPENSAIAEKLATPKPSKLEKLVKTIIPPIERAPEKTERREIKRADELALPELLAVAKRMEFHGVAVDQLYERGRIDSLGLRRAVDEFLQGRQFEAALIENMHRYESPEYLKVAAVQAGGAGQAGGGNSYGAVDNGSNTPPLLSKAPISSSAYGASGFGTASRLRNRSQTLPPAYIAGAVILGLIIAAILIL